MPKRTDIHKILIIGAGPIVIGQACEFDYSGTQACKALREEGYEVVLVNSNPATIMTDPEMADRTYIEPITPAVVEQIIAVERPDAAPADPGRADRAERRPGPGRERASWRSTAASSSAPSAEAIRKAEDRDLFKQCMDEIGLESARSGLAHSLDEARDVRDEIGLPCVLRPSFTLGGSGGGIAYNKDEFDRMVAYGLELSPVHSILVEECLIGWKEYEMEVMRDGADNAVIVCSIENFDPMGVHTGDCITVAPAQTLTDKEYQRMRDASLAILRKIGVETGGSNVQFAVDPQTGRMIVIEMNPRVSRSSALASKATGFPIAKIAAKLAVGFRLDEIRNDITRETPACFEPTIDYVVTKIPRWAFEKFPEADPVLTTQMKSVGEVMAIGRTFSESFQKALRGLEVGRFGLGCDKKDLWGTARAADRGRDQGQARHAQRRAGLVRSATRSSPGSRSTRSTRLTGIDPWFLHNLARAGRCSRAGSASAGAWRRAATTCPRGEAERLLRPPARAPLGRRRGRGPPRPRPPRDRGRVQAGRHLRRGVRGGHALLLFDLRGRGRGPRRRQAPRGDPRRRAEPDRPGDRVRLLLLPGRLRPARPTASRSSWSTRTPRPSAPTTTPPTASSSSP